MAKDDIKSDVDMTDGGYKFKSGTQLQHQTVPGERRERVSITLEDARVKALEQVRHAREHAADGIEEPLIIDMQSRPDSADSRSYGPADTKMECAVFDNKSLCVECGTTNNAHHSAACADKRERVSITLEDARVKALEQVQHAREHAADGIGEPVDTEMERDVELQRTERTTYEYVKGLQDIIDRQATRIKALERAGILADKMIEQHAMKEEEL